MSPADARRPVIRIEGRFTFDTRIDFRARIDEAVMDAGTHAVAVDLSRCEYIDSAALGLLLILRDEAKRGGKSVSLVGAKGVVRDILKVAAFERLFDVE